MKSLDQQLIDAAKKGDLEVVKELLSQGADIHVDDDYAGVYDCHK